MIAIAGAGVAGLALAIDLAQRGIPSTVFEARDAPAADGAGIQLGPNATRVLQGLGVRDELQRHVCAPDAIVAHDGGSGRPLQRLPLGDWIGDRHGAPYWVIHRRDLHRVLTERAHALPKIALKYGHRIMRVNLDDAPTTGSISQTVELEMSGSDPVAASVVIGADGLWSQLRHTVAGDAQAGRKSYAGKIAARTVLSKADAPEPMRDNVVGAWMSPRGHLVHYPIEAGRAIAVVLISKQSDALSGWGHAFGGEAATTILRAVAPTLPADWAQASDWRAWSLVDPPALPTWSRGALGLIGDAAHPILPFFAQGGAMALEDAQAMAAAMAACDGDWRSAFARFEVERSARVRRVQTASRRNGQIFHLPTPAALARNAALRLIPGDRVMAGYDWLYGYRRDAI